jgi:uncharacterized membrane protein YozB (DUF420 family)
MVIISPGAPLISDAILIVEVILVILMTLGFTYARKHQGTKHHWIMLVSFAIHIVFGVALMVFAFSLFLGIINISPLVPHAALSTIVVILGIVNITLGFIWRSKPSPVMVLPPKERRIHQVIGITLLVLWYIAIISGIFVYFTLY